MSYVFVRTPIRGVSLIMAFAQIVGAAPQSGNRSLCWFLQVNGRGASTGQA